MPTGYTSEIEKGISFKTFVMQCARAMGACVSMRDDSNDTPIPKRFEPSQYHPKRMLEIIKEKEWLVGLSIAEAEKEAKDSYYKELEYHKNQIIKGRELQEKYKNMLLEVNSWEPPTSQHVGLKDFMREQIQSSIKFDCNTEYHVKAICKISRLLGNEWLSKKKAKNSSDFEYNTTENIKERERASHNTNWINDLRESLK